MQTWKYLRAHEMKRAGKDSISMREALDVALGTSSGGAAGASVEELPIVTHVSTPFRAAVGTPVPSPLATQMGHHYALSEGGMPGSHGVQRSQRAAFSSAKSVQPEKGALFE
jgi:hypothetical protein